MGGVAVDLSCRVLDRRGQPISNLYAVGELAGVGGATGIHPAEGRAPRVLILSSVGASRRSAHCPATAPSGTVLPAIARWKVVDQVAVRFAALAFALRSAISASWRWATASCSSRVMTTGTGGAFPLGSGASDFLAAWPMSAIRVWSWRAVRKWKKAPWPGRMRGRSRSSIRRRRTVASQTQTISVRAPRPLAPTRVRSLAVRRVPGWAQPPDAPPPPRSPHPAPCALSFASRPTRQTGRPPFVWAGTPATPPALSGSPPWRCRSGGGCVPAGRRTHLRPDGRRRQMGQRHHLVAVEQHAAPVGLAEQQIQMVIFRAVVLVGKGDELVALGIAQRTQGPGQCAHQLRYPSGRQHQRAHARPRLPVN